MSRRILMAVCLALAVAGCAAPTPYQPAWMGDGYGYTEQRIEQNRYRVTATGTSATDDETLRNYVLYRAAEITLAQGGDYFLVVSRSLSPQYGLASGPVTSVGTSIGSGGGSAWSLGVDLPLAGGGGPRSASAEILIHRGAAPKNNPNAFDARTVKQRLTPRIRRPGP